MRASLYAQAARSGFCDSIKAGSLRPRRADTGSRGVRKSDCHDDSSNASFARPQIVLSSRYNACALWLVAAHNWDTTGALSAGWKATFVQRAGTVLGPLDKSLQIVGQDLGEVS